MTETLRETVTRYADAFLLAGNDYNMDERILVTFAGAERLVFRQVGRNATHLFYLAVDSHNRLWHASAAFDRDADLAEFFAQVCQSVHQDNDFGYLGHH